MDAIENKIALVFVSFSFLACYGRIIDWTSKEKNWWEIYRGDKER